MLWASDFDFIKLEAMKKLPLVDYWKIVDIKLAQAEKEQQKIKSHGSRSRSR